MSFLEFRLPKEWGSFRKEGGDQEEQLSYAIGMLRNMAL